MLSHYRSQTHDDQNLKQKEKNKEIGTRVAIFVFKARFHERINNSSLPKGIGGHCLAIKKLKATTQL
jgi:hypothetical protein